MTLALDTNAVQALLQRNHLFQAQALEIVATQPQGRHLVISPFVYAECYGIPSFDESTFLTILEEAQITVDMNLPTNLWRRAGLAHSDYHKQHRREGKREPKRLLADFLIGAHALSIGASLMTFDTKGYQASFPELELLP